MSRITRIFLASCALFAAPQAASAQPASAWPASDEIGMANTLGPATWKRCAPHLANPRAKSYELSLRSLQHHAAVAVRDPATSENAKPTVGIPGSRHAFNTDEMVSGDPGQQGTQMDALGHFAVLPEKWDGKGEFPSAGAKYYGGFTQQQVKPQAGLAVAEARHRQGAADRDHRGAARRQEAISARASRWSRARW